jgi:hypothetical protein
MIITVSINTAFVHKEAQRSTKDRCFIEFYYFFTFNMQVASAV